MTSAKQATNDVLATIDRVNIQLQNVNGKPIPDNERRQLKNKIDDLFSNVKAEQLQSFISNPLYRIEYDYRQGYMSEKDIIKCFVEEHISKPRNYQLSFKPVDRSDIDKSDYVILSTHNEWITSCKNLTDNQLKNMMRKVRERTDAIQIFAYKVDDVVNPKMTKEIKQNK